MPEITLKDVLLVVFGGGAISTLIAVLKLIVERYDIARKNKKEDAQEHTTLTIESRRLDLEEEARTRAEWDSILENHKKRIEDLKLEIVELKSSESLSRPTLTKIYQNLRTVRRNLELLDLQIVRLDEHNKLSVSIEALKKALDELEQNLP